MAWRVSVISRHTANNIFIYYSIYSLFTFHKRQPVWKKRIFNKIINIHMDSDFFKYQEIIKSTESPDQLSIKIQLCTSCQPKPNANFSDELFCCHFVKQGQEEPRE